MSKANQSRRSVTPTSQPPTPPTPTRNLSPGYPYAYLNNGSPGGGGYPNQAYYNQSYNQWNNGYQMYPPHPQSPSPTPSHQVMPNAGMYDYYQQPQMTQFNQNYPPPLYYQNYYGNNNLMSSQGQRGPQSSHFNKNYIQNRNNYQENPNQFNNQNRGGSSNFNNRNGNGGNSSFGKNKNKNKKNKLSMFEKRDLPENNKFYCEVCDRGFKDEPKYNEHVATHQTCGVNGCAFTAAAKLVEIHYRNFHATGIDKKVSNLKTPEDIQKYINDRKKNFPSKSTMEKKCSFEKEKSARGVSLNTQQFGKLKPRHKNSVSMNVNASDGKCPGKKGADENQSCGSTRLNPSLVESKGMLKNRKKKNNKKSLFQQKMLVLKSRYNKPTLLQRLLADEIRHERNVLLQCVRFVVQNNFFDKN